MNKQAKKRVFNCYKNFIKEYGYPPSYEQVNALTGLSIAYISMLVCELVDEGYFERPRDRVIIIKKEFE